MGVELVPVAGLAAWVATLTFIEQGAPRIRRRREVRREREEREQSRLLALEELREKARARAGEPPRSFRILGRA